MSTGDKEIPSDIPDLNTGEFIPFGDDDGFSIGARESDGELVIRTGAEGDLIVNSDLGITVPGNLIVNGTTSEVDDIITGDIEVHNNEGVVEFEFNGDVTTPYLDMKGNEIQDGGVAILNFTGGNIRFSNLTGTPTFGSHDHSEGGLTTVPNSGLGNDTVTVAGNSVSLGDSATVDYVDLSDTGVSFPIPNSDLSNDTVTVAGNAVTLGNTTTVAHGDLSDSPSSAHHSKTSSASELSDVSADSVSGAHHSKTSSGDIGHDSTIGGTDSDAHHSKTSSASELSDVSADSDLDAHHSKTSSASELSDVSPDSTASAHHSKTSSASELSDVSPDGNSNAHHAPPEFNSESGSGNQTVESNTTKTITVSFTNTYQEAIYAEDWAGWVTNTDGNITGQKIDLVNNTDYSTEVSYKWRIFGVKV